MDTELKTALDTIVNGPVYYGTDLNIKSENDKPHWGIDTRVFANLSLVNWQTFIISHRLFPAEVLNQLYDPQTRLSIYSQSHWGIDTRVFVNISIRTVSGNLTTFR